MCHYFQVLYLCGHRDIINAPCEWRDEGIKDEQGRAHPCDKTSTNRPDLTRLCMSCSPNPTSRTYQGPTGQEDLINLRTETAEEEAKAYFPDEGLSTMEIMIRNETYLRKRAKRALFIPTPTKSFTSPSNYEIEVQLCINREFLLRRYRRNYFQDYISGKGIDYQDYLETVDAHAHAAAVLQNTVLTVLDTPMHPVSIWNEHKGTQTSQTPYLDSSTQTIEGDAIQLCSCLVSRETETSDRPRAAVGKESSWPLVGGLSQQLPANVEGWSDTDNHSYCRVGGRDVRSRDSDETVTDTNRQQESSSNNGYAGCDEQAASKQILMDERSAFIGIAVSPDQRVPDVASVRFDIEEPLHDEVLLDSPEGIAYLENIKEFLGMAQNASPLDVYAYVERNKLLIESISEGTIPIPHRRRTTSRRRRGFALDRGLNQTIEISDKNWEARKAFVHAWNSLEWASKDQIQSQAPQNVSDCRDGEWDDENEDVGDDEERSFAIREVIALYRPERTYSGRRRLPANQPRAFSPLRKSSTYADPVEITADEELLATSASSSASSYSSGDFYSGDEDGELGVDKDGELDGDGSPLVRVPERSTHSSQLVSADSAQGQALLSRIRQLIGIPESRTALEVSSFIDSNEALMTAIRHGRIPAGELPVPSNMEELRWLQRYVADHTRYHLAAPHDQLSHAMRLDLMHALRVLDWDAVDSAPVPLEEATTSARHDLGSWDEEAERAGLRGSMVYATPAESLVRSRCNVPSPLRSCLSGTRLAPTEEWRPDDRAVGFGSET